MFQIDFGAHITIIWFWENMIYWLMWRVSSASISILVHGSPSKHFPLQKSLRHGDPISSFLFTLVDEALNFVIVQAKEKGLIKVLKIAKMKWD